MLVVEMVHVITMRVGRRSRGQSEESARKKDERRSGRSEHKILVEMVHVKRKKREE